MNDIERVELEYKEKLSEKLRADERLEISAPSACYPEPFYVYVKCKKTGKTIAVRLDGEDRTMRFWDYADDDYSDEDGIWDEMTDEGIERFTGKLYSVMEHAADIEFYNAAGECDDFVSGIFKGEITPTGAARAVKKAASGRKFAFVAFADFFGGKKYLFDKSFREVKLK